MLRNMVEIGIEFTNAATVAGATSLTLNLAQDTNVRFRPTLYSSALSVVPLTMRFEVRGWDLLIRLIPES